MSDTVCAVIVTYNRIDTLKTALQHILDQNKVPERIIIVDNNSTDGTIDYLRTLEGHAIVHPMYLPSNVGSAGAIAAAMKEGIKNGKFDYFWILDDDTFYEKNALNELLDNMHKTDFAMIGLHGAHIKFGRKIMVSDDAPLTQVDYSLIDGSLIKTEAIEKSGVVDERFFMMCDDHEYSLRLRQNGFKIGVLKNGADNRLYLGGHGSFTRATLWRGYYSARNHMLIIRKYFSIPNLLAYIWMQIKLLTAAALFAPDRFKRVRYRLKGIWHGIRGIGGRTLDPGTLEFDMKNRM
ncbi:MULTISPECIES: glycosyltransferase [unclassified Paraflavitalea]|uniref:glycosyltransferase n=1 Tax=unclassified Paraflavitalea TaxID=2798305 RepID=UPI003D3516DA